MAHILKFSRYAYDGRWIYGDGPVRKLSAEYLADTRHGTAYVTAARSRFEITPELSPCLVADAADEGPPWRLHFSRLAYGRFLRILGLDPHALRDLCIDTKEIGVEYVQKLVGNALAERRQLKIHVYLSEHKRAKREATIREIVARKLPVERMTDKPFWERVPKRLAELGATMLRGRIADHSHVVTVPLNPLPELEESGLIAAVEIGYSVNQAVYFAEPQTLFRSGPLCIALRQRAAEKVKIFGESPEQIVNRANEHAPAGLEVPKGSLTDALENEAAVALLLAAAYETRWLNVKAHLAYVHQCFAEKPEQSTLCMLDVMLGALYAEQDPERANRLERSARIYFERSIPVKERFRVAARELLKTDLPLETQRSKSPSFAPSMETGAGTAVPSRPEEVSN